MKKEIGIIGLGKMGWGIAKQLQEKGWRVIVSNRSPEKVDEGAREGMIPAYSFEEFLSRFQGSPRVIWLMLPAGEVTEETLFGTEGISPLLRQGDIVIDGGNSHFKDDAPRAKKLEKRGIQYLDVGVSGGPAGARNGACLMIGGEKNLFSQLEELFKALSLPEGYAHFEGMGAGHFVKMVHNGVEYGMMQAIGEGFNLMKQSPYRLDLEEVTRIYNTGSVIESRLVDWLHKAYQAWGVELDSISGTVKHSGEGAWTVETAQEMGELVPVIEASLQFRKDSEESPSYTGKVVSALRGQFGGHPVKK